MDTTLSPTKMAKPSEEPFEPCTRWRGTHIPHEKGYFRGTYLGMLLAAKIIIITVYLHQEMNTKSTNISISPADKKGQLRRTFLTTKKNSSISNTEALCCVEIGELT